MIIGLMTEDMSNGSCLLTRGYQEEQIRGMPSRGSRNLFLHAILVSTVYDRLKWQPLEGWFSRKRKLFMNGPYNNLETNFIVIFIFELSLSYNVLVNVSSGVYPSNHQRISDYTLMYMGRSVSQSRGMQSYCLPV